MQASVKVMRSYDYCHFEVALSGDIHPEATPKDPDGMKAVVEAANTLRKMAAVLVDEAVRQYKITKEKEQQRSGHEWQVKNFLDRVALIEKKPQSEWTVDEAATMRAYADHTFLAQYEIKVFSLSSSRVVVAEARVDFPEALLDPGPPG